MDNIPIDIQNIIINYKNGSEHYDKFKHCLKQINKIETAIVMNNTFYYFNGDDYNKTVQIHTCSRCNNIKFVRTTIFTNPNNFRETMSTEKQYGCCDLDFINYSFSGTGVDFEFLIENINAFKLTFIK